MLVKAEKLACLEYQHGICDVMQNKSRTFPTMGEIWRIGGDSLGISKPELRQNELFF